MTSTIKRLAELAKGEGMSIVLTEAEVEALEQARDELKSMVRRVGEHRAAAYLRWASSIESLLARAGAKESSNEN